MSVRSRTLAVVALACATAVTLATLAQSSLGAFGSGSLPAPRITSAPLRPSVSGAATFAFRGMAGTTTECSLDSASFVRCPSPVTYRGLALGVHAFRVRVRAAVGDPSSPATFVWSVVPRRARALPRPVLTTVPQRPWTSPTATFAWTATSGTRFECGLDGARWATCRSPHTYGGLSLGAHDFRVRARGAANRDSRVNRFTWVIAPVQHPSPPHLLGTLGVTTGPDVTIPFEVPDGTAASCSLDGGAWQPCGAPVALVGLHAGAHTFCIRTVSPEGVAGEAVCRSWIVTAESSDAETGGAGAPPGLLTVSGSATAPLTPGSTVPLPLTLASTYDEPITVTSIVVAVAAGSSAAGCDGQANLAITQSNSSGGAVSVVVPPHGSVTLPTGAVTAPSVTMLDLPTDQNACKGATFTLTYGAFGSGS